MRRRIFALLASLPVLSWSTPAAATKLTDVAVVDESYVVVSFLDGEVEHDETGIGEIIHRYTPALSVTEAAKVGSWTIKSSQDTAYGATGKNPTACSRKTKMSGQAQLTWGAGDWNYEYTYQHSMYLRLPTPLKQGMSYTLEVAAATNTDVTSRTLTFDIFSSRSEAVHVNIVGYSPDAPHKAADLYDFLGEAGPRDYSSFVGKTVYLYNVGTSASTSVGTVALWKSNGSGDLPSWGSHRFIVGGVWSADFAASAPGTYRLAIDGVGCSDEFTMATDVYANPFRVALRGFAYMRLGQDTPAGTVPPYRQPTLRPGVDPTSTVVYITTVQPYDGNWSSIPSDPWDNPDSFAAYMKAGHPTNPSAWGGHADAADRDRHLGHVSIIYDLLLPYILTRGALADDNTGIPESGNGVPDVIDEAAYEVDFWLRLRDGAAYSHGLTNPSGSGAIYQAGTHAIAAWTNAANAAMLADAYRLAGRTTEMATYRDAAATAYAFASSLVDTMLDRTLDAGGSTLRGRDLKMLAAAYLYNVTGDTAYEDEVNADSVCRSSATAAVRDGTHDQIWATAGYLFTPQPVHYPTLQANMRAAIIADAKASETSYAASRPSRRASDDNDGWFPTTQNVQRTLVAHAVATSQADRDLFRKALALEADWGLGRNPDNRIHMTTWFTPLAAKRSIEYMYTSGSGATSGGAGTGDGVVGVHPGHTPYLNLVDWWSTVAASPTQLTATCYPSFDASWPEGEAYFNTPWVYAYSEYTPQQSFRGKTALYGYLYAIGGVAPTQPLVVARTGTGAGTVSSTPAGIDCGSTCIASFTTGATVSLTATPAAGSTFDGWGGACSGTGACIVTLDAAQSVTAAFTGTVGSMALTVTRAGTGTGGVTSTPAGIDCGATCAASFPTGTAVTLTATPAAGSTFAGWSGACSGTGTCAVTLDAARAVTATFTAAPGTFAVAVAKTGTGAGAVASTPAGIDCGDTCAATFAEGTPVTLTATPASGSVFVGWSGACADAAATCVVTASSPQSVTAQFDRASTKLGAVTGSCSAGTPSVLGAVVLALALVRRRGARRE